MRSKGIVCSRMKAVRRAVERTMAWNFAVLFWSYLVLINQGTAQQQFSCSDGDLRLVGGREVYEGRVEVCFAGVWGTVCDDIWNSLNAEVVCSQLDFNFSTAVPAGRAYYGEGTGPIYMDNINCEGSEQRLIDCPHIDMSEHNCRHYEDAGVYCQPQNLTCGDGDIRLVNGEMENEGRVEVCFSNQWGTVCDDRWDNNEAAVVCGQLGYSRKDAIAVPKAMYGPGIGSIYFDDFNCDGTEENLTVCQHRGFANHNCHHLEDAGVLCKPHNASCINGELRLADGRDESEGRIEVCFNGRWGTVCDDLFDRNDAQAACNQLGHTLGAFGLIQAAFGPGEGPVFLDNLDCTGDETELIKCRHDGVGIHNCRHSEDASVVCVVNETRCEAGAVRLVDGDFPNEGRVEVCAHNTWGTVCGDSFDTVDAAVVCSQLNYTNGQPITIKNGFFGQGKGMIWLDDVACTEEDTAILNCAHNEVGDVDCSHGDDACIICPVPAGTRRCEDGDVRLTNDSKGLVEICFNGRWGAICHDDWDNNDAAVLCRQLGFPGDSALAVGNSYFGSSSGPIFLDDTSCYGNETRLLDCYDRRQLGKHNCDANKHAGVICPSNQSVCENGWIRLVDGGTLLEGRVEMCFNSQWGTVCDTYWDNSDATVVCRQLSLEYGYDFEIINAVSVSKSAFGRGKGLIFLKGLHCVGTEDNLLQCPGGAVGVQDCDNHNRDAGVYCGLIPCNDGDVRLSNSMPGSNNNGLAELCIRNVWTALCDEGFTVQGAQLVCSRLGFSDQGAQALGGDFFGHAHLIPSWMVKYTCSVDSTTSIRSCWLQPDKLVFQCKHAGVVCKVSDPSVPKVCTTGDLRLVGGANSSEGRVEVCINDQWGEICDDSWDNFAATVVCRQLRLPTLGATAKLMAAFGQDPSLPFMLDDVKCLGEESKLIQCQSSRVLSHNCLHGEEAGVTCHGRVYTSTASSKGDLGEEDDSQYSPGQVVAIIVPVVVVVVLVMTVVMVIIWLMFWWRKRPGKMSDQFPIVPGEGIVQFREFTNEEEELEKPAEAEDM